MYYVTICTYNRQEILSKIDSNYCRGRVPPLPTNQIEIKNTEIGEIIENTIKIINQKDNVKICNYIIMPNHIHCIIQLEKNQGRDGTLPLQAIIGRFKSFTTKQYNLLNNTIGIKLWQRNYFEHIIRNEKEYLEICKYMKENPIKYYLNKNNII